MDGARTEKCSAGAGTSEGPRRVRGGVVGVRGAAATGSRGLEAPGAAVDWGGWRGPWRRIFLFFFPSLLTHVAGARCRRASGHGAQRGPDGFGAAHGYGLLCHLYSLSTSSLSGRRSRQLCPPLRAMPEMWLDLRHVIQDTISGRKARGKAETGPVPGYIGITAGTVLCT